MDKIIEAILEAIPFADLLTHWGLSSKSAVALASILIATCLYWLMIYVKKLQNHWQNKKTATDLSPYFEYKQVKQARDLFIQTQAQNISPTHEDELQKSTKFSAKIQLVPWFINTAFNEKKDDNKYYLILADSGMGKTTFMINLYVKYNSKYGKKRNIKLIPFGDDRIIKHLEELAKKQDEAKNTILLLDAFDEYKGLLPPKEADGLTDDERFRKRLDEIVRLTRDFREVVITSRTQYFPGQEDKPYELKIPRFDEKGFHTLAKLYLSPFETKEIHRYLNKKYGRLKFWNWDKKRNAQSIVDASPRLMVRPMLLAYIDYLVDSKKTFETTYDIYETLIDKWIEREAKKRKYESTSREKFKNDLSIFSQKIALNIYENLKENQTASIDKATAQKLCEQEQLDLEGYEITGQSLLTRDINHNWKFAHKSILEFFLAKYAIENFEFFAEMVKIDFAGMDMTKTFYSEKSDFVFVEGGTFRMEEGEQTSNTITIPSFYMAKYPVTQRKWQSIMGNNPSHFKGEYHPVENVSWYDACEFINKLNLKTALHFRLPSESEWEFAARGGTLSQGFKYAGSNSIDKVAWYDKNSNNRTHPVGQKQANELGLYDMSGNVFEWCEDDWHDNIRSIPKNGEAWIDMLDRGPRRVLRGGSYFYGAVPCRSAIRYRDTPDYRDSYIGFRLVLPVV